MGRWLRSLVDKLFTQTESHGIKFDHHIKGVPYIAVIFLLTTSLITFSKINVWRYLLAIAALVYYYYYYYYHYYYLFIYLFIHLFLLIFLLEGKISEVISWLVKNAGKII